MKRTELEELVFRMPEIARTASNPWAVDFANSMIRNFKRTDWQPSPKQTAMMRKLVAELSAHNDDVEVNEE